MKYLLDTDICIYVASAKQPARRARIRRELQARRPQDVAISVITEAELRAGAAKSAKSAENARLVDQLVDALQVVPFTSLDTRAFATARAELERAGTPIEPYDLLIGAQALARGLVLVTNNEREFSRLRGLVIENWSR